MTEDFKTNLQGYLLGNADDPEEPVVNEPQFQQPITTDNSIQVQIADALGYDVKEYESVIVLGNIVSKFTNFTLFYGRTPVNEETGNQEDYIAVFNSNDVLQFITKKFDSGSNLFDFICMKEDEEGYIYGLSVDSDKPRIVLLNKILMETNSGKNSVKIRTTYIVPYSILSSYISSRTGNNDLITKSQGESIYFIVDETSQIIRFKINVGSQNEWIQKNLNFNLTEYKVILQKADFTKCYIYSVLTDDSQSQVNTQLRVIQTTNDKLDFASNNINVGSISYSDVFRIAYEIETLDINHIYISRIITRMLGTEGTKNVSALFQIDLSTNPVTINELIDEEDVLLNVFQINNLIFLKKELDSGTDTILFGLIHNNQAYFNSYTQVYGITEALNVAITNKYNLYEIRFDGRAIYGERYSIQLIYNPNNYNGKFYINPNMLVPNSSVLKDNNGKIIFARNLYNKIIQGSTTTSVVQVPNTLLNDTTISNEELYSLTNNQLNDNNVSISKNIYETLNINFNNTISVLNNNDTNNPIQMLKASEYVNKNISNEDVAGYKNYSNQIITWFRFNYTDGTSTLEDIRQNIKYNNLIATINIKFYAKKDTNSIDILSFDKLMIYSTLSVNLKKGHYYNVIENIRIS